MTTPNEQLVNKAITAADQLASSGRLNADQGKQFLDYIVDQTTWKSIARTVRVDTDWEINKIALGKRVAMPAVEAQDPGLRRNASTSKIVLTPREIIVPVEISDGFSEENIEGGDVASHVVRMFAAQTGNDLEELFLHGDLLGVAQLESDLIDGGDSTRYIKDSFLALSDGWLRQADSANVYNAAGTNIGSKVFSAAIRTMPTKFRRNRADLAWLQSSDLFQLWLEGLTSRVGSLADGVLQGNIISKPYGIQAVEMALLQFQPLCVEHKTLVNDATAVTLRYTNIAASSVVVTLQTLGSTPTTKFIEDTDFTVNYAAGTVIKVGGGIPDGSAVKITYQSSPQMLLTPKSNLVCAIGRDVRIERARIAIRRVDQYVITMKVAVGIQEPLAVVKVKNIGTAA